jgi:flagellar hook-basal body complex protein FliE
MSIAPIPPLPGMPPVAGTQGVGGVGGAQGVGGADGAPAPGFGEALGRGLQQVSSLEHNADALIEDVATGGPTKIHEVMAATSQASLATDLLVQVRDRALESYHEVMRMQL